MLATFDAPNGDSSCVRRRARIRPLQALTTLNETVFVESAGPGAAVLDAWRRTDPERLAYAFRRVLGRTPTADERKDAARPAGDAAERIAEGWVNPRELATGTEHSARLAPGVSPANSRPTRSCPGCC